MKSFVNRVARANGRLGAASLLVAFFILALILAVACVFRPDAQAQNAAPAAAPRAAQAAAPAAKSDAAPAGNAQNGTRLYARYGCYECHGYHGEGSSATGVRLGPRPISFDAFKKYIRAPTGDMPPYTAKVVSDAELVDIYAFLQALPQPPKLEDIPLLK